MHLFTFWLFGVVACQLLLPLDFLAETWKWGSPIPKGIPHTGLRCGIAYGADCDSDGDYPCCSPQDWCGITAAHCNCPTCVDFRHKAIGDSSICQSEFQEYTREQFVNQFICNDPNTMESINRQICGSSTSNCFRCQNVQPRFSAKHHSHILKNGKLRIQSHCAPKPTYGFDDHAAGEQCNQLIKNQLTCSSGDNLTEELCDIHPDVLFQGAVFGRSRVDRTNFNCCRKKLHDGVTPQCHTKREPVSITLHIVKDATPGPTRIRSRRKQRRNHTGGHRETIREEIQFYLPSSCCAIV